MGASRTFHFSYSEDDSTLLLGYTQAIIDASSAAHLKDLRASSRMNRQGKDWFAAWFAIAEGSEWLGVLDTAAYRAKIEEQVARWVRSGASENDEDVPALIREGRAIISLHREKQVKVYVIDPQRHHEGDITQNLIQGAPSLGNFEEWETFMTNANTMGADGNNLPQETEHACSSGVTHASDAQSRVVDEAIFLDAARKVELHLQGGIGRYSHRHYRTAVYQAYMHQHELEGKRVFGGLNPKTKNLQYCEDKYLRGHPEVCAADALMFKDGLDLLEHNFEIITPEHYVFRNFQTLTVARFDSIEGIDTAMGKDIANNPVVKLSTGHRVAVRSHSAKLVVALAQAVQGLP